MIEINLNEASTTYLWAIFEKNGLNQNTGTEWICQRFKNDFFEMIRLLVGSLKSSIVIKGDGPRLISLQLELAKMGVSCLTPVSADNSLHNFLVLWHCY